jgi:hypothetical protein
MVLQLTPDVGHWRVTHDNRGIFEARMSPKENGLLNSRGRTHFLSERNEFPIICNDAPGRDISETEHQDQKIRRAQHLHAIPDFPAEQTIGRERQPSPVQQAQNE